MISRSHRFHGFNSLKFVYRNGRTVRGPLFSTKFALNPRRQNYRLAVVVSRKVHKSAFGRNRIRRRLYEIARQLEPRINQPFDVVITVFHETVIDEDAKNLAKEVKRQLKQAGILSPKK